MRDNDVPVPSVSTNALETNIALPMAVFVVLGLDCVVLADVELARPRFGRYTVGGLRSTPGRRGAVCLNHQMMVAEREQPR